MWGEWERGFIHFHVSMLRKYLADMPLMLDYCTVQLDESLAYEEEPDAIVGR